MSKQDLISIAERIAKEQGLDQNLVLAIIKQESAWNQFAVRYEPNYSYLWYPRDIADKYLMTFDTMTVMQKTSFGLMQTMYALALELGFQGYPAELCDPENGVLIGCKQLKRLYQRYGNEDDVIAAYNAGQAKKLPSGMYSNQKYVDGVHQHLIALRRIV